MARMDIYAAPGRTAGLVVDVQSDLLSSLPTRAVVPLVPKADGPRAAEHLNPVFAVHGADHMLLPQYIAAVPAAALRTPVGDLRAQQDRVMRALDRLLTDT